MMALNPRYRIYFRDLPDRLGETHWTTRAATEAEAIANMHAWFAQCGPTRVEVTRTEIIPEEPAPPYDAEKVLRSLRWITG